MDHGPFPGGEFEVEAQGFEDQEDVGEEDRGVDAEDLGGRHGDLGGEVGILAEFQEPDLRPHGAVLRHVTAGLPHQPDGGHVGRFAATGAEEVGLVEAVVRGDEGGAGHGEARRGSGAWRFGRADPTWYAGTAGCAEWHSPMGVAGGPSRASRTGRRMDHEAGAIRSPPTPSRHAPSRTNATEDDGPKHLPMHWTFRRDDPDPRRPAHSRFPAQDRGLRPSDPVEEDRGRRSCSIGRCRPRRGLGPRRWRRSPTPTRGASYASRASSSTASMPWPRSAPPWPSSARPGSPRGRNIMSPRGRWAGPWPRPASA